MSDTTDAHQDAASGDGTIPFATAARVRPASSAPLTGWHRVLVVWALSLGGGALVGLHILHAKYAPLAYFSTVPWILVMVHPRLQGRGNLLAFGAGLHVMTLVGLLWLKGQGTVSWMLAPTFYWPLVLLVYPLFRLARRNFPALPLALLWPLAWVGVEWLRIRLSPGELALCVLGYSQIALSRLVQVADLFGVAAVSFALAAVAGFLADAILSTYLHDTWRQRVRHLVPSAIGLVVLFAAILGYGTIRFTESHFSTGPTVLVLQPNLPRSPDARDAQYMYDLQVVQTLSVARPDADLIAWPENSITAPFHTKGGDYDPYYGPDTRRLAAKLGAPLLIDGWTANLQSEFQNHTSALVATDGSIQLYDKVRLLPWTEYIPLRGFFGLFGTNVLHRWMAFVGHVAGVMPLGQAGDINELRPFKMTARDGREFLFGTPICFEVATSRVVNRWHRQGVHFLVNQTSEGKLGDEIHETTIAVCGFRAIEGRVSIVRATNDGISALIDPNGRLRDVLRGRYTGSPINEAGVLFTQVILDDRRGTIYSRIGDAFAITCLLVAVALAAAARLKKVSDSVSSG